MDGRKSNEGNIWTTHHMLPLRDKNKEVSMKLNITPRKMKKK